MRNRFVLAALCCLGFIASPSAALEPPIARHALKSGADFVSADVRAMQADDFANPGMLWVTRGERLWRETAGTAGKSCAACHADGASSMKGVATRYPRIDPGAARLVNLEGRVNLCRERHQGAKPFAYESDELLALTAYVTHQSRGMPMSVSVEAQNAGEFERARELYYRRIGQMNLACAHCHDRNWGRTLFREKLSQGHGTGFPASASNGRRWGRYSAGYVRAIRVYARRCRSTARASSSSSSCFWDGARTDWRSKRPACGASRLRKGGYGGEPGFPSVRLSQRGCGDA